MKYSAFIRYWRKNGKSVENISGITGFKKAYDLGSV
jgi:hypothetical protein